jgi:hypothetical protein
MSPVGSNMTVAAKRCPPKCVDKARPGIAGEPVSRVIGVLALAGLWRAYPLDNTAPGRGSARWRMGNG